MKRNSDRHRVNIVETPVVPESNSLTAELRAELRSARELLAIREAREGPREVMVVSPKTVAHPRLRGLHQICETTSSG